MSSRASADRDRDHGRSADLTIEVKDFYVYMMTNRTRALDHSTASERFQIFQQLPLLLARELRAVFVAGIGIALARGVEYVSAAVGVTHLVRIVFVRAAMECLRALRGRRE